MHKWGSPGVDWKGINDAAYELATFFRRWGRMHVLGYKEKWGEVRVSVALGYWGVPLWVNKLVVPYHEFIYRLGYKMAIKKRPHLTDEIIEGADYPELLISIREPRL